MAVAFPLDESLLKSVSRSFYLSLRILPAPIRPVMGVGYLLCRAADTLADTDLLDPSDRLKAVRDFRRLFEGFPVPSGAIARFLDSLPSQRSSPRTADDLLVAKLPECGRMFNALGRTDQALVQSVIQAVTQGMETDISSLGTSVDDLRALTTKADLERYVGFIGGEPGRFWTNVCLDHLLPKETPRQRLLDDGFRLGLGLQRVNILRDLPRDLRQGRCYVPTEMLAPQGLTPVDLLSKDALDRFLPLYHRLIDEALEDLNRGIAYLRMLPKRHLRLRLAVWWPLIFGMDTLSKLRLSMEVLNEKKVEKVPRRRIYSRMLWSFMTVWSNRWLTAEAHGQTREASSSLN